MNKVINTAARNILKLDGKEALIEWSKAIEKLGKDIYLIKALHQKVGQHLANQINKTYNGVEK